MQCPACKSASPDDVRFCLHCGQYLGEPEDVTRVSARQPPPSTIRANFQPQVPYTPRGPTFSYEEPQPRSWPRNVAVISLAAIALMSIGGLITAMLFTAAPEQRKEPTNNTQAGLQSPRLISATATPMPSPTIEQEVTPLARSTPTPIIVRNQPTPGPQQRSVEPSIYQPTPTQTPDVPRLGQPAVVIERRIGLRDGAFISWNVAPGYYQLELTAANDGARVEWQGTENCDFKTRDMLEFTQRCKMLRPGTLMVSNPTTFGLGAAIVVTVRVTRF